MADLVVLTWQARRPDVDHAELRSYASADYRSQACRNGTLVLIPEQVRLFLIR